MSSYTAELVNGRVYIYRGTQFDFGKQVVVDEETANYLEGVQDIYSVKSGGNIAQPKFKIRTFSDAGAAQEVVQDLAKKDADAASEARMASLVGTVEGRSMNSAAVRKTITRKN